MMFDAMFPQGLKPATCWTALKARLKSCPFKAHRQLGLFQQTVKPCPCKGHGQLGDFRPPVKSCRSKSASFPAADGGGR